MSIGRGAEGADDELDAGMGEGDFEEAAGAVGGHVAAAVDDLALDAAAVVVGELGDAFGFEQVVEELLVLGGDEALEVAGGGFGFAVIIAGDEHVDAVGAAADMVVDPAEFLLEIVGGEGGGAEDAEAAGLGDFDDDVAAVGEGEDRDVAAEGFGDFGAHSGSLLILPDA